MSEPPPVNGTTPSAVPGSGAAAAITAGAAVNGVVVAPSSETTDPAAALVKPTAEESAVTATSGKIKVETIVSDNGGADKNGVIANKPTTNGAGASTTATAPAANNNAADVAPKPEETAAVPPPPPTVVKSEEPADTEMKVEPISGSSGHKPVENGSNAAAVVAPTPVTQPPLQEPTVKVELSKVDEPSGAANGGDTKQPALSSTTTTNGAQQQPVAAAAPITDAPMTTEHRAVLPKEEEEEETGEEDPVVDEEEAIFLELEKEQEKAIKEEALHPQPKEITAAPKLLQDALKTGDVKADESEEESDREHKPPVAAGAAAAAATAAADAPGDEKKGDDAAAPGDDAHHVHNRANQLDFLLNKASEYSNFIAQDLKNLQNDMAEQARQAMEGRSSSKKSKKRKGEGKDKSSKKQKTSKGSKALATAQANDSKARSGGGASSDKKKPIFVQPKNLAPGCFLKDYQLEGVRWLASLYENGVSGILADEMGLGKTIQCVALIAHLLTMNVSGPFLIVAPLATLQNWVREFEKWLPSSPVIRYHGTGPERDAMLKGPLFHKNKRNKNFPFIVTSYEVVIRDLSKLEKLGVYTFVIVDEGHRLKNHRCTLLTSLKRLKAANRLLMTGTPIQNTLDELWSLLNFVNPQIFDDLSVFQSWFGFKDIGQNRQGATDEQAVLEEQRKNQTVSKLHEILRPFLLRRIKRDVLSELPPKKEVIIYSGVSKLQAGYADLIEKGTLRDVLLQQGIESGRTLSQTNKLMNHRKNINHPFLFGEPIDPATGAHMGTAHPQLLVRASGKFALLDRMLDRLHRDGHQVLIFSQMTSVLNVMEDYLLFRRWRYCRIDGTTKLDDRVAQMDKFNSEKTAGASGSRNVADDRNFVFLLSTRAGGLGINLISADTVILFDSDWNPHADSQAMDRCHRIGQTQPVAVYRLLTVNSVDIEMMEKQISKKKLERMTIAGGDFRKAGQRSRSKDLNFDHLRSLLESDIKDLTAKGGDVEDIKIGDQEFDVIMDRKKLFTEGEGAAPTEGKMYDILDASGGDLLGAMNA